MTLKDECGCGYIRLENFIATYYVGRFPKTDTVDTTI